MIMKQHSKKTPEKPVDGKQGVKNVSTPYAQEKNEALNKNPISVGATHTKDEKSKSPKKKNS